jgi:hypothetical protein
VGNVGRPAKLQERLFPVWKLIGFGLGVAVMMGMLYTSQPILKQIQAIESPNDISVFF